MKTVENYTAYIIGRDGRIQRRIDFKSPDDDHARQFVKKLITGNAMELWQRARKIDTFEPGR